MSDKFDDCIYCGKPNGSREHTVLAAAGAKRIDRGILCGACNNGLSAIDAALADDLRALNALVGVHHGRTRTAIGADVQDAATGRSYTLSDAGKLRHTEALVLHDRREDDGTRDIYVVASTDHQFDDFVRMLKAEGKPLSVGVRERIPLYFAETPIVRSEFGETDTYRAIAKSALNVLAHHYPSRARESWLDPIKHFIRDGGGSDSWIYYEYPDEADPLVPPDSFPIQHRFLIGFDARTGLAYAKVSFFGVYELCIRFGLAPIAESETFIYDIDVLAAGSPGDVRNWVVEREALCPPGAPTPDPSKFVDRRLASFLRKRDDLLWEAEAHALVESLNEVRNAPEHERRARVVDALEGQQQRLLNQAVCAARMASKYMTTRFGEDGRQMGCALLLFAEVDGSSRTGVTEATLARIEILRGLMADHLLSIINERSIQSAELRSLLEGPSGVAVVGPYVFDEARRRYPESADVAASVLATSP